MTISLSKNQAVNLVKPDGSRLTAIRMTLGWTPARRGRSVDLDASCIMLDEHGTDRDVVWFGHLSSNDGAVRHSGDDLTGGSGESITVDLASVPAWCARLVFTVNSFSGQNFRAISDAYCRLADISGGTEADLGTFSLGGFGKHDDAVVMSVAERTAGGWQARMLGRAARAGRTWKDLLPLVRESLS
jgi:tellurium resistance protein TerZ